MKRVAGLPLITRIIKVLQACGFSQVFIMSNILELQDEGSIKIIRKKEDIPLKLGDNYFLVDIPIIIDNDFLKYFLKNNQIQGVVSLSKIKDEEIKGVYIPIINEKDIKAGEKKLLKSLRKPWDTLISRTLNRPVSLFISSFLMKTSITPNQITVLVFLIGLLSPLFLIIYPNYLGGVLGGLMLHISSVLDGCDGEIARLKFQSSRLGLILDTISDETINFLFIGGLGIYCSTVYQDNLYFNMALIAMGLFIVSKILQYTLIILGLQSEDIAMFEFDFANNEQASRIKQIFGTVFKWASNIARRDFLAFSMMLVGFAGLFHIGIYFIVFFTAGLFVSVLIDFIKKMITYKKQKPISGS
jgi:phosphatidylglycerophosphate synthase